MTSQVCRIALALCASLWLASMWLACAPAAAPPRSPSTAAPAAASTARTGPSSRAQRRALMSQAGEAYDRKDFAACAVLFEQAHSDYNAACCHAQAGALDAAFTALARAI